MLTFKGNSCTQLDGRGTPGVNSNVFNWSPSLPFIHTEEVGGNIGPFLLKMINSHFHSLIRSETNILFQMSFFVFSALPPKLTMRPKSLGTNAIMRITDQQQCVGRASCELILAGQCRGKWQSLRLLLGRQKREQEQVPHPTLSPASPLSPCILLSSLQLGFSFF